MFKAITLALVTMFTTTVTFADAPTDATIKLKVETLKSKGCKVPTPGWVNTDKEYTDAQMEYLKQQYADAVDQALSNCKG